MTKFQISNRQLIIMATIITIGDSMLVLPFVSASASTQDAWISFLLGTAIGMSIITFVTFIAKLFPNLTLVQYNEKVFGRWIAMPLSLFYLFYIFLNTSAHIREIADFLTTQIMPDTPIHAIIFLTLLATIYGARHGIEVIARTSEVFFPWLILFMVIIILLLVKEVKMEHILPIMETGIKPILRGSIPSAAFPFMELSLFFMIFPLVKDKSKITKNMLLGAAIGGILIFCMVILSILVLGPYITVTHIYPSYALAKKIDVGGFLQRIEATLAILWIMTIFLKISVCLYAFTTGIAQLIKIKNEKILFMPFGMILYFLSIILAPNIAYFNRFISQYWSLLDFTFAFVVPLLLLTAFTARKWFGSGNLK
ncbi:GerAB/ArcD/ProY family transporter [Paenibacillus sp. GXUN7292]|uniref:GerAB/ArcD/ProY family transporter n=1 Tax=Paenibacillus sp. GXUN7292 TaxID=3422499 RepID=UPI003D7C6708